MNLEEKATLLRRDVLKMIAAAGSGHPGGSLSVLDMLVALYYNVANIDPSNPNWEDRDRIVLSKGHACPALYAVLADLGYFPKEDLLTLRKIDSHLQGHPDRTKTPGVDLNTGSLGQGVAVAAGMALAAKYLGKKYRVYVIIGDGEMQEGLVWEAAMAAAHYKLDNYTVMLDHNGLQIDGTNDQVMSLGDPVEKYQAFGFDCCKVNGHDIEEVTQALKRPVHGKPKFICCETIKGKGVSFMENQVGWHGKAPDAQQLAQALAELEVE